MAKQRNIQAPKKREPEFPLEEFNDFSPIELTNFYGFLYSRKLDGGGDIPLLIEDLQKDTRAALIDVQKLNFVMQFEEILKNKFNAMAKAVKDAQIENEKTQSDHKAEAEARDYSDKG